jgi:cytochrome c
MNSKIALIVGTTLLAALAAPAMANQELAQKKACMACHAIDKKVVGPAFLDVAKKYKGQKGIEAKLAEKVVKGGGGVWGTMAMPANAQVTPAEATQLVKWVLALK